MSTVGPPVNRTLRPGHFTITVPGTWVDIPLQNDDALRRTVSAVVKRQIGTDDRLALMRADARTQLTDSAKQARAAGAVAFALSLELVPGVPFPVSLVADHHAWPTPAVDGEPVEKRFARDFPNAELVQGIGPRVFARHRRYEQRSFGTETTMRAELEYLVPDSTRLLLRCVFSVEMIDKSDVFVDLFDVIVGTVRFPVLESEQSPAGTAASLDATS